MQHNNFIAFILSHGRAETCTTHKMLRKSGYTGRIVFVVDDEDKDVLKYKLKYGAENVVVFVKKDVVCDACDNTGIRTTELYARKAVWDIARQMGARFFLILDDDYNFIEFKKPTTNKLKTIKIKNNLDRIFDVVIDFLHESKAASVCFAQGGDFIGGARGGTAKAGLPLKRKAMNSFFCDVENPFEFRSRMNGDVSTYLVLGAQGRLFFTITKISINQTKTQSLKGGITEIYNTGGTYQKSFYSVMNAPSCCTIKMIQTNPPRIHHAITWDDAVPLIINEKYKKK